MTEHEFISNEYYNRHVKVFFTNGDIKSGIIKKCYAHSVNDYRFIEPKKLFAFLSAEERKEDVSPY